MAQIKSIPLAVLQQGDKAIITGFATDDVPTKFYSIGIIPGTEIQLYRKLPLGGAVSFLLIHSSTKLAVSRAEAQIILTNKLT